MHLLVAVIKHRKKFQFANFLHFKNFFLSQFLDNEKQEKHSVYLSINPRNQRVELNWFDVDLNVTIEPTVLITDGPIRNVSTEDFLGANRWVIDDGVELLYELMLNTSEGRQQTHLKHSFWANRRMEFDTGCYKFWLHLVVDGVVTSTSCLRTNAFWMNEMRKQLENRKIRQIFLPGTHDSASYKRGFDPTKSENIVTKYTVTQDDDAMSQLIHGIRYLDIRVGYYRSNNEKFWANHGISRMNPLAEVLQQVKEFVDATNEIVILDFQEFPVGFNSKSDIHKLLVFFLFEQLAEYAVDPELGWDGTLNDIWRSGKRIIIAYDHFGVVQNEGHGILWQSVRQRWGKVKNGPAQLTKFLRESRANASREFQTSRPFAEMAELTPELGNILSNDLGSLRHMADNVNFDVTKLYHGDFGHGANIVAVDFYHGTNIVDVAISRNKRKFRDGSVVSVCET